MRLVLILTFAFGCGPSDNSLAIDDDGDGFAEFDGDCETQTHQSTLKQRRIGTTESTITATETMTTRTKMATMVAKVAMTATIRTLDLPSSPRMPIAMACSQTKTATTPTLNPLP